MQLVPVLDIRRGIVVRGVGGRREEYRPLVSCLTDRVDPVSVAEALREKLGCRTLYLADLDAILDRQPHGDLYSELAQRGFELWVDAGIRGPHDLPALEATGVETIIVGLETCAGPGTLKEFLRQLSAARLMFSLDLHQGRPLTNGEWPPWSPCEIAASALAAGFRRLLVLDLADVGCNTGGRTDGLLRELRAAAPEAFLAAGGGVRDQDDLARLAALHVDAVLAASALHDGRLTATDLRNAAWSVARRAGATAPRTEA
uniref:HisA/hisF family protein n=1 Tax=Schlesneria paludicola TaxID=360056 RepID=A0A7C4LRH4_9PLAN